MRFTTLNSGSETQRADYEPHGRPQTRTRLAAGGATRRRHPHATYWRPLAQPQPPGSPHAPAEPTEISANGGPPPHPLGCTEAPGPIPRAERPAGEAFASCACARAPGRRHEARHRGRPEKACRGRGAPTNSRRPRARALSFPPSSSSLPPLRPLAPRPPPLGGHARMRLDVRDQCKGTEFERAASLSE